MKEKYCSLCLNESNVLSYITNSLIFIRTIEDDFSVAEEMLELITLHGTTIGINLFEDINKVVSDYGDSINVLVLSLIECKNYGRT